jgi:peptidoglycan/LPS O-acetylase OafA/YrhL
MMVGVNERWHALDAVRGGALLLGIAFHATMSFIPGPQIWIVADNARSVALSVTFFVLHIFRMTTFFLIAGFFAHLMFHRRGLGGFLGDRLKRILVPLLVGWPILFAAILAVSIWAAMQANGGHLPKPPPPDPRPGAFPLTHLWFLYVLLEFYVAILLIRGAVALIDRAGDLRAGADRAFARVLRHPLSPILLAAPLFAALWAEPVWLAWFGVPTPDYSLITNIPAWTGFGFAFAFGWMLNRQPDLMGVWERRWAFNLVIAIAATAGCLAILGPVPVVVPAKHDATRLGYAACYALAVWTWTFAIIGLALRFLSGHSPARRYVADASYWLYLIHLPLVMALQVGVSRLDWPWFAKYALILGIALPLMLLSYHWLVRYTFIGAILNGRRRRRAPIDATKQVHPAKTEPVQ